MEKIVVGCDGSQASLEAVEWACEEAERNDCEVRVVESWKEPLLGDRPMIEIWRDPEAGVRKTQASLDAAIGPIAARHPNVALAAVVVDERADQALVKASAGAFLTVVGSRGRGGFASLLLGSVSQKVAERSSSSVVVVRGPGRGGDTVVVGVDGTDPSRHALAWAARAARQRSSRLHIVMAWSYLLPEGEHGPEAFRPSYTEEDARSALQAIVDDVLGPDLGSEVILEATCALAAKALLERAQGASLLVVGAHEPASVHFDLGSVAAQLLHHSPCPVALIRGAAGAPTSRA